jgi:hypothetical protein
MSEIRPDPATPPTPPAQQKGSDGRGQLIDNLAMLVVREYRRRAAASRQDVPEPSAKESTAG